jgi:hypothetical protein
MRTKYLESSIHFSGKDFTRNDLEFKFYDQNEKGEEMNSLYQTF